MLPIAGAVAAPLTQAVAGSFVRSILDGDDETQPSGPRDLFAGAIQASGLGKHGLGGNEPAAGRPIGGGNEASLGKHGALTSPAAQGAGGVVETGVRSIACGALGLAGAGLDRLM